MRGQIRLLQSCFVAERTHVPMRTCLVYGGIVEYGFQQRVLCHLRVFDHYFTRHICHLTCRWKGIQRMFAGSVCIHTRHFYLALRFDLRWSKIIRCHLNQQI